MDAFDSANVQASTSGNTFTTGAGLEARAVSGEDSSTLCASITSESVTGTVRAQAQGSASVNTTTCAPEASW